VYVIVPADDLAAAVEVLDASDGIESVAVASADSPTGQAAVELDGGALTIEWRESDGHVLMTGPVAVSFRGTLDPSLLAQSAVLVA
jgi:hypothetical protein